MRVGLNQTEARCATGSKSAIHIGTSAPAVSSLTRMSEPSGLHSEKSKLVALSATRVGKLANAVALESVSGRW